MSLHPPLGWIDFCSFAFVFALIFPLFLSLSLSLSLSPSPFVSDLISISTCKKYTEGATQTQSWAKWTTEWTENHVEEDKCISETFIFAPFFSVVHFQCDGSGEWMNERREWKWRERSKGLTRCQLNNGLTAVVREGCGWRVWWRLLLLLLLKWPVVIWSGVSFLCVLSRVR